MRNIGKVAEDLGFTETEYAFYKMLKASNGKKDDNSYEALSHSIVKALENLAVIDWVHKDDVQREMRRQIKSILRSGGYHFEEIEVLIARIMDLARVRMIK